MRSPRRIPTRQPLSVPYPATMHDIKSPRSSFSAKIVELTESEHDFDSESMLTSPSIRRSYSLVIPRRKNSTTPFPSPEMMLRDGSDSAQSPSQPMRRRPVIILDSIRESGSAGGRSTTTSTIRRHSYNFPHPPVTAPQNRPHSNDKRKPQSASSKSDATRVPFYPRPFDNTDLQHLDLKLASSLKRRTNYGTPAPSVQSDAAPRCRSARSSISTISISVSTRNVQTKASNTDGHTARALDDFGVGRPGTHGKPHATSLPERGRHSSDDPEIVRFGFSYGPPSTEMATSKESHMAVKLSESPSCLLDASNEPANVKTPQNEAEDDEEEYDDGNCSIRATVNSPQRHSSSTATPPANQEPPKRKSVFIDARRRRNSGERTRVKRLSTIGKRSSKLQDLGRLDVDVYLVSDVPEGGFLLDHAGTCPYLVEVACFLIALIMHRYDRTNQ